MCIEMINFGQERRTVMVAAAGRNHGSGAAAADTVTSKQSCYAKKERFSDQVATSHRIEGVRLETDNATQDPSSPTNSIVGEAIVMGRRIITRVRDWPMIHAIRERYIRWTRYRYYVGMFRTCLYTRDLIIPADCVRIQIYILIIICSMINSENDGWWLVVATVLRK